MRILTDGTARRHHDGEETLCPCGQFGILKWRRKYNSLNKNEYPVVYHYDPQLYLRQKSAYKRGERKSKPNGVIWHYYKALFSSVDGNMTTKNEILALKKKWKERTKKAF